MGMILVDAACPRLSEYVTPNAKNPRCALGILSSHDRFTWPVVAASTQMPGYQAVIGGQAAVCGSCSVCSGCSFEVRQCRPWCSARSGRGPCVSLLTWGLRGISASHVRIGRRVAELQSFRRRHQPWNFCAAEAAEVIPACSKLPGRILVVMCGCFSREIWDSCWGPVLMQAGAAVLAMGYNNCI